jgi:deferrochelatase/peroxidase EfeB
VLLSIHGRAAEHCDWRARELLPDADSGLRELCRRPTARQRGNVEAFGFADGRSQPAIEGVDTHAVGDGVYANRAVAAGGLLRRLGAAAESAGLKRKPRGWRLIRAGEFLLGYENEDGVLPPAPPAPLGPNGTYMVYRELDQNKAAFDGYLEKTARAHGIGEKQLGAKIVGRWQDGTPVARVPDDPDVTVSHRRANDFRYEDDLDGFGCPLGAHVRRANPRDGLPGGAERTMRHRIIRRGMPYEGGLAFICFSASIENGFEFIQREWINDGTVFGLDGPDFLLQQRNGDGRPHGRMVIPGYRTIILQPPDEPFVTVQGCDYLFVPSRRACAWLAGLAEAH